MTLSPWAARFGRNKSWRNSLKLSGKVAFWAPLSFCRAIHEALFACLIGAGLTIIHATGWTIVLLARIVAGLFGFLKEPIDEITPTNHIEEKI